MAHGPSGAIITALEPAEPPPLIQPLTASRLNMRGAPQPQFVSQIPTQKTYNQVPIPRFVDVDLSGSLKEGQSTHSENFYQAPGNQAHYYARSRPPKSYSNGAFYPGLSAAPTQHVPSKGSRPLTRNDLGSSQEKLRSSLDRFETDTVNSRKSIIDQDTSSDMNSLSGHRRKNKSRGGLIWLWILLPIVLLILAGVSVGIYYLVKSNPDEVQSAVLSLTDRSLVYTPALDNMNNQRFKTLSQNYSQTLQEAFSASSYPSTVLVIGFKQSKSVSLRAKRAIRNGAFSTIVTFAVNFTTSDSRPTSISAAQSALLSYAESKGLKWGGLATLSNIPPVSPTHAPYLSYMSGYLVDKSSTYHTSPPQPFVPYKNNISMAITRNQYNNYPATVSVTNINPFTLNGKAVNQVAFQLIFTSTNSLQKPYDSAQIQDLLYTYSFENNLQWANIEINVASVTTPGPTTSTAQYSSTSTSSSATVTSPSSSTSLSQTSSSPSTSSSQKLSPATNSSTSTVPLTVITRSTFSSISSSQKTSPATNLSTSAATQTVITTLTPSTFMSKSSTESSSSHTLSVTSVQTNATTSANPKTSIVSVTSTTASKHSSSTALQTSTTASISKTSLKNVTTVSHISTLATSTPVVVTTTILTPSPPVTTSLVTTKTTANPTSPFTSPRTPSPSKRPSTALPSLTTKTTASQTASTTTGTPPPQTTATTTSAVPLPTTTTTTLFAAYAIGHFVDLSQSWPPFNQGPNSKLSAMYYSTNITAAMNSSSPQPFYATATASISQVPNLIPPHPLIQFAIFFVGGISNWPASTNQISQLLVSYYTGRGFNWTNITVTNSSFPTSSSTTSVTMAKTNTSTTPTPISEIRFVALQFTDFATPYSESGGKLVQYENLVISALNSSHLPAQIYSAQIIPSPQPTSCQFVGSILFTGVTQIQLPKSANQITGIIQSLSKPWLNINVFNVSFTTPAPLNTQSTTHFLNYVYAEGSFVDFGSQFPPSDVVIQNIMSNIAMAVINGGIPGYCINLLASPGPGGQSQCRFTFGIIFNGSIGQLPSSTDQIKQALLNFSKSHSLPWIHIFVINASQTTPAYSTISFNSTFVTSTSTSTATAQYTTILASTTKAAFTSTPTSTFATSTSTSETTPKTTLTTTSTTLTSRAPSTTLQPYVYSMLEFEDGNLHQLSPPPGTKQIYVSNITSALQAANPPLPATVRGITFYVVNPDRAMFGVRSMLYFNGPSYPSTIFSIENAITQFRNAHRATIRWGAVRAYNLSVTTPAPITTTQTTTTTATQPIIFKGFFVDYGSPFPPYSSQQPQSVWQLYFANNISMAFNASNISASVTGVNMTDSYSKFPFLPPDTLVSYVATFVSHNVPYLHQVSEILTQYAAANGYHWGNYTTSSSTLPTLPPPIPTIQAIGSFVDSATLYLPYQSLFITINEAKAFYAKNISAAMNQTNPSLPAVTTVANFNSFGVPPKMVVNFVTTFVGGLSKWPIGAAQIKSALSSFASTNSLGWISFNVTYALPQSTLAPPG